VVVLAVLLLLLLLLLQKDGVLLEQLLVARQHQHLGRVGRGWHRVHAVARIVCLFGSKNRLIVRSAIYGYLFAVEDGLTASRKALITGRDGAWMAQCLDRHGGARPSTALWWWHLCICKIKFQIKLNYF